MKGHLLSRQDYLYGMMMVGAQNIPPQRAKMMRLHETIMDMLIDRELLAAEAQRLGFSVGDEEVEDLIAEWLAAGKRKLMLVSSWAGDGKSMVTSNLAVVLGQLHLRVALIDGDLRM